MSLAGIDEFKRWKVDVLKSFLRNRGLKTTARKDELVALAYAANYMAIPVKVDKEEEKLQKAQDYRALLHVDQVLIPDPMTLETGWLGEESAQHLWPPCMIADIQEFLISKEERSLGKRLLSDYKEGKAYSYFDSNWLGEVFYQPISEQLCLLKASCIPSQNIMNVPHRMWVCLEKTGTVKSAYCTCFAGYV